MSPPNSSSRFTAQGDMWPVSLRRGMPYLSSSTCAMESGSNRPSGLSKTGLSSSPAFEHVDRAFLHQLLQPFGERRFAAADRPEQIEDLLALLQALRGVTEIADDALDGLFEAVELLERRVDLDGAVHEDPAEPLVGRRVDDLAGRRSRSASARPPMHTSSDRRGSLRGIASGLAWFASAGRSFPHKGRKFRYWASFHHSKGCDISRKGNLFPAA